MILGKTEITNYINEYIDSLKDSASLDKKETLMMNLKKDILLGVAVWIVGATVIGIPIVYGLVAYRGGCLGYTIASFIAVIGIKNGTLVNVFGLFIHNIIFVPSIILIAVSGMNLYKKIINEKRRDNIKIEFFKHSIKSLVGLLGIIVSDLVRVVVSTNILIFFAKYL